MSLANLDEIVELYRRKKNLEYDIALLEHKKESERQSLGPAGLKNISSEIDSKENERRLVASEVGKREATLTREEGARLEILLASIYREHRNRMLAIGHDKH